MRFRGLALVSSMALAGVGCSAGTSSGDSPRAATATSSGTATAVRTTSILPRGEHELPGTYRQGIAQAGDGWLFTNDKAIYRTDASFTQVAANESAIPGDLAAQGYDHLGDGDVVDGVFWVPLEREDKSVAQQVTARYDSETLQFIDSFIVAQHHNAFVTVDPDGIVYSADQFDDDTILRYRVRGSQVEVLDALKLTRKIARIQGGDVALGALWLSTDDEHNGLYRVDLKTGETEDIGSMGRIAGEGEGIDAGELATKDRLHALVVDENIVPAWVEIIEVRKGVEHP